MEKIEIALLCVSNWGAREEVPAKVVFEHLSFHL